MIARTDDVEGREWRAAIGARCLAGPVWERVQEGLCVKLGRIGTFICMRQSSSVIRS